MRKRDFKVIGFDADDTLWVNEPYFQHTEKGLYEILAPYAPAEKVAEQLFATEMRNLDLYGYGAKGFLLSMIETALSVSENRISQTDIARIIELGKQLINMPITLLDNVFSVLDYLKREGYVLVVATKGDLLDQQRKLRKSNIADCFHHVEIMSDKKESDYLSLFRKVGVSADDFLMVGNSFKSDIQPVINIGGYGVHIPFHTTWQHEELSAVNADTDRYIEVSNISELVSLLKNGKSN